MTSERSSVLQCVCIVLVASVAFAQNCPDRDCFPETIVSIPCVGDPFPRWTSEASQTDCSIYLSCFNGVGIQMCCPEGMYYNPEAEDCDDQANVDCQIDPCPEITTIVPPEDTTTDNGSETTTDSGAETTTENEAETTTENGAETTTENGAETTTGNGAETTTDSGAETTTENGAETTTNPGEETTTGSGEETTTETTTQAVETTTTDPDADLEALCAAQASSSLVELAYPGNCNMYIVCENNQLLTTESCPAGLHFNPTLSLCDSRDLAECLDFVCKNNIEVSQVEFGSVNSCQMYFICVGTTTVVRHCAPGTIYDIENGWCAISEPGETCERARPPPPPAAVIQQCAPDADLVKIAHPTLCDVYYRCLNGQIFARQCSAGLMFDPEREQCNFSDEVLCEVTP